jgi:two-component system, OmpR family, response regulator ResD
MGTRNFRVLVVDEGDDFGSIIHERLESRGYEVRRANGSEEGYSTFLSFRPDLVIMDLVMSEEAGVNLMRYIRNFAPNMRIIYIIGNENRHRSVLLKEKKRHRAEFLQKPFAGPDLMRLVYEQEHRW